MTEATSAQDLFKGRHFDQEIIVLCVRWYLTFKLSSRDLVQMMAERGIGLAHTTILRWVQRYVPDFEKRWNQYARAVGDSWRVDETYIKVKGQWVYLYRAVDKQGRTVDFLLSLPPSTNSSIPVTNWGRRIRKKVHAGVEFGKEPLEVAIDLLDSKPPRIHPSNWRVVPRGKTTYHGTDGLRWAIAITRLLQDLPVQSIPMILSWISVAGIAGVLVGSGESSPSVS
jgi:hypothetical protein